MASSTEHGDQEALSALSEVLPFLTSPRPDVLNEAYSVLSALCSSQSVLVSLSSEGNIRAVLRGVNHAVTRKAALEVIVNISANPNGQITLTRLRFPASDDRRAPAVIEEEIDLMCKSLSNLTLLGEAADQVVRTSETDRELDGVRLLQLAQVLSLHPEPCYDYIAAVLCNVSTTEIGREWLLGGAADGDSGRVKRPALPYITPFLTSPSRARRAAAVGTLRNCVFLPDSHTWALQDPATSVLPAVLPRLTPATATWKDSELPTLPSYLEGWRASGGFEQDVGLREELVDVLVLLGRKRAGRVELRNSFVYPVMRELHLYETTLLAQREEREAQGDDGEKRAVEIEDEPAIFHSIQRVVDIVAADEKSEHDE